MCPTLDHEDDNIKRLKCLVLHNVDKRLEKSEACKVALIFYPGTRDLTEKKTAKKTIRSIVTKLKSKGILNFGSEAEAESSGKNSSERIEESEKPATCSKDNVDSKKQKLCKEAQELYKEILQKIDPYKSEDVVSREVNLYYTLDVKSYTGKALQFRKDHNKNLP